MLSRTSKAFFFLLLFGSQPALTAESNAAKSILVIFGSQNISPWVQSFSQSLLSNLPAESITTVLEFLPLANPDPEEAILIAESLRDRRSNLDFDLIIAVFPGATNFLAEWGDIFAADADKLYVLPTEERALEIRQDNTGYVIETGIVAAARNTLQALPSISPSLEQLYVLGGDRPADRSYMNRIERALAEFELGIDIRYFVGLTPDELISNLDGAPENSAILMSTYTDDRLGTPFTLQNYETVISQIPPMPVFVLYDRMLGWDSVVGGNITNAGLYGSKSAEVSLRVLAQDDSIDNSSPPTEFLFDIEQLNKFGINRNALPLESALINDNTPLWQQYFWLIALTIAIITIQLILIGALLESGRRRKKAEEGLKEVHTMEALGHLAGGIAHDFNNILMAIMGNAEIANATSGNPKAVTKHLDRILQASNRAKTLVGQILLFSRHSNAKAANSIDLHHLLEETSALIQSSHAGSTLDLELEDELWSSSVNPNQIQQVIMNLCVNAQYAMQGKGTIKLVARNLRVDSPKKLLRQKMLAGDYVSIAVSDTGSGMSNETISRAFEPFFTTKPAGEGTGLGLSLVYEIVKTHAGYLDLKSTEGRGTTVTVYLKASKEKVEKARELKLYPSAQSHKRLVLLVDDDQMTIDINEEILQQLGYQVAPYTSSREALVRFEAEPNKFDVVVSDLSMPEMDGIRLITNIRRRNAAIPALLFTGYLNSIDQSEIAKLENFGILYKPSGIEEISTALSKLFVDEPTNI